MSEKITIVGGGLAGSEAAWQAAQCGCHVELYEMRPIQTTPAHKTGQLAELVCSNSFRGAALDNAVGLLKEEMRRLDSLIMRCADQNTVPAGGALAVDRHAFASAVEQAISTHPRIRVIRREVDSLPSDDEEIWIIATGPLTSDRLAASIQQLTGEESLSYFDAAAPIVSADSIDERVVFRASRYGKGQDDAYINCPLNRDEYTAFYEALLQADRHEPHDFEKGMYFEGCLPIEEMARRGYDTLRFGPMKPVGLVDPRTGEQPFAVVQLRQDNREGTLWNMVGFQTSLRWGAQKRVFRMIPGLENAEFERYGVIHRNTFLKSPRILQPTLQTNVNPNLFFAGQITGVEGYVESAAAGIVAGINAARLLNGLQTMTFPRASAIGSLCHYITTAEVETFQPKNISFGMLPLPAEATKDKRKRRRLQVERALQSIDDFKDTLFFADNPE